MIKTYYLTKKTNRIVAIFATILFMFYACTEGIDDIRTIPDIINYPAMTVTNAELFHSQYGKVKLKVSAKTIEVYSYLEDPKIEFPEGILVEFFDDNQNITSYLTADKATYFENKSRWEALGNVEAKNVEGTVFNTEYIEWDEKEEIIKSDRFIKVTEKDAIIVGRGFRAKQDFTDWKIFNISGDFNINQRDYSAPPDRPKINRKN